MFIFRIATLQMCSLHHYREGWPEMRNTSFAEAALESKSIKVKEERRDLSEILLSIQDSTNTSQQ